MSIGSKIRTYRKEMGLTQYDLAQKTDISPMSIRRFETDQRTPSTEYLSRLASALNCSPNDLFDWEDKWSIPGNKRSSQSPKEVSDEKALIDICELLDYAGLDFALTTDEIKRITKITRELHKALINDIKENTKDIII